MKHSHETHPVRPYNTEDDRALFQNDMPVASATECTGLIPAAAETEEELHAYSEIYDIPLSRCRNRNVKDPTAAEPKQ